jgi:ribosomal protein S27E
MVVTCDFCGATVEGETPPLTWVVSFEQGRRRVFCQRCSRQHLRSIEGKLDSDWW